MAETEKYPHVTYFFDGGSEHRSPGEEWSLVDSPRDVPTYDRKPAMSAQGVSRMFCEGIAGGSYGFGLVNFANADMVGHTGVIPAVVEAVETVDRCLADVVSTVDGLGGVCLITADHGNAEQMLQADGSPHTAHTTNPVPLILTGRQAGLARRRPTGRCRADRARPAGDPPAGQRWRAAPCWPGCDLRQERPLRRVSFDVVLVTIPTILGATPT